MLFTVQLMFHRQFMISPEEQDMVEQQLVHNEYKLSSSPAASAATGWSQCTR